MTMDYFFANGTDKSDYMDEFYCERHPVIPRTGYIV